ncbi:MAG: insulinase family protein [Desulfobacterales bacterium]|nr:insulinase family protein [Desulfobacterales bacterium]
MNAAPEDRLNEDLQAKADRSGFAIDKALPLTAIGGFYYALTHKPTGARYIHISRDDTENAFGVGLKTVPRDSSGVAHILEHTVLCGSDKYPVRDPFFAMLKRSLSTFMNAFTASDWTLYPFATQNRKDFYNLMDVYLDAVFFPRLDEASFRQEGHRFDFETDEQDKENLVFKGVVFNEMKGAMSSPDQIMARSLLNALYPDTTYRHNSGGDPQAIPDLTWHALKQFHQRHYHPSNAFFYSYGSFPLEEHLVFIEDKVLRRFEPIDPRTAVDPQPRWATPREATYTYPIAPGEDTGRKCQIGLGWLLADIQDTFEVLALALLEQILLGNQASPLRRALMESELGTSLADASGFDADNRDTLFFCGLKNVAAADAEAIIKLILTTLERLANEGIAPDLIEAAIHQIEFHRKEVTNAPYPYGLKLLLFITSTWLHGGRPESVLDLDQHLTRLRDELAQGPFFEQRIRTHLLENPHRILFKLLPDEEKQQQDEVREKQKLQAIAQRLSADEQARIRADAAALKARQETDEDLGVLPTLSRSDIPPSIRRLAPSTLSPSEALTCFQQPTGGIFYLTAALDLPPMPDDSLHLLPFFAHAFTRMGTGRCDYTELARRLDRYTGGFDLAVQARTRHDAEGTPRPLLTLGAKCLDRYQENLFELVAELTGMVAFTDIPQLRRILLEYRAALERAVIHNGHRLAISLASRGLTPSARLNELWHGVHQLRTIKSWGAQPADDDLERLSAILADMHQQLFRPGNLHLAAVAEGPTLETVLPRLKSLPTHFPSGSPAETGSGYGCGHTPIHEGWQTSTAVNFVARAFPCVRYPHEDAPALAAIAKMLRSLYLHREIREKGGAYGGFALYNPEDGLFALGSYRDPHIVRTLEKFDGASDFIVAGRYSDEDIKEAILQVCADIDKPDAPGTAARKAFFRQLTGLADEVRQRFKERLLALDRKAIAAVAKRYFSGAASQAGTAVIGSQEAIARANSGLASGSLEMHTI